MIARTTWLAPLILALTGIGCGEETIPPSSPSGTTGTTSEGSAGTAPSAPSAAPVAGTPSSGSSEGVPQGPGAAPSAPSTTSAPATTPSSSSPSSSSSPESSGTPPATTPSPSTTPKADASDKIRLEPVKFAEFQSRIAANTDAKYTLVDAWATWCGPCKENFPHLVEMHRKYAGKGLAVVSLSFDDTTVPRQIEEAKKFLREKNADFTNFVLDEPEGAGFEKLDINGIPAVFIYGPGGKLVKRFTLDNPNKQFTYDEVEKFVVALLDGKPLPNDAK